MRAWGTRAALAAFVLTAWGVQDAAAQEPPRVLVLTYQGMGKGIPPELTEQTTVIGTEEMKAAGLAVLRADDVVSSEGDDKAPAKAGGRVDEDAPSGDPEAGERAEELIARAKLSMEDQEFGAAVKQLNEAIRMLDDNGDAVPDLRLLPEAYLQLGAAYFQEGDEDEGDDALTKVVHYAPFKTLSEDEWPPVFITVYDRVRYNVLRRPRARIEVKAAGGAQVLLDGRNLGRAPLVLTDVLPGSHWIRIERPGESIQVKKVLVRSKRTTVVEFSGADSAAESSDTAVGVLGAISKNEINRSHVDQLRAAGRRQDAALVMFGGIHKTETAYNIYSAYVSVEDGSVGRLANIAFDLDLLSAQIEVYKLAEDAKTEASEGFSRLEEAPVFPLAPKVKLRKRRRRAVASGSSRSQEVVAAPPPVEKPKPPSLQPEPEPDDRRKPTAVAKDETGEGSPTPVKTGGVVPKDEADEAPKVDPDDPATSPTATAIIPKDEDDGDDDDGSLWWVWVVVGVAVAGAGGGVGTYFLLNQQPEEGNLRITW